VRKNCLTSVATLTTEFQTASGSNVSTRTVHRELHDIGFHGRAAAHKPKITMPNVGYSGVKLTSIGLWSSRNAFSRGMNQFGGCQENITCPKCKVWWKRNNGLGLFFIVWAGPLVPVKGNLNTTF
jgi:hypothetical protein